MGLKGFRLWFMGQMNATCRAPPSRHSYVAVHSSASGECASMAPPSCGGTQVEFEKSKGLKPGYYV
jgi:hypothetical protein